MCVYIYNNIYICMYIYIYIYIIIYILLTARKGHPKFDGSVSRKHGILKYSALVKKFSSKDICGCMKKIIPEVVLKIVNRKKKFVLLLTCLS